MKLLLCAAQTRCTTNRPINPNLTCICSQFGRENRPGAEDTACAHTVAPRPRRGTLATTGPPLSAPAGPVWGPLSILFLLPFAPSTRTSPGQLSAPLGATTPHCTRCPCSPGDGSGPQGTVRGQGRCLRYPACSGVSTAFSGFRVFS